MRVEEAILVRLLSLSPVTAITSTRWFLLKLPQSVVYPAGRVQCVDEQVPMHLRGPVGTNSARVQVDMYVNEATSGMNPYTRLGQLADAVEGDGLGPNASGLLGWKGDIGSPAFRVLGIFRAGDYGVRYDAEELKVLTRTHDYFVHWTS